MTVLSECRGFVQDFFFLNDSLFDKEKKNQLLLFWWNKMLILKMIYI